VDPYLAEIVPETGFHKTARAGIERRTTSAQAVNPTGNFVRNGNSLSRAGCSSLHQGRTRVRPRRRSKSRTLHYVGGGTIGLLFINISRLVHAQHGLYRDSSGLIALGGKN
jgi:hypothetical protein